MARKIGVETLDTVVRARIERDLQKVALAHMTDVGEVQDLDVVGGDALALRQLPARRIELGDDSPHRGHRKPREGFAVGDGDLVLDRRGEQPGGGEHPGMAGHHHSGNAEIGREPARVKRTRAAHGDQCEFSGVEPLAYRDEANAFRHLGVDHSMDTGRGVLHRQSERLGDAAPDCVDGPGGIETNGTARELLGVQESQHHRGVGHRRFPASARVAGGSGVGGGGVRPDAKAARLVQPRDAAAARSDCVHVDHRHPHREAVDHSLGAQKRLGAGHERDVRAGAAHVERDEVVVPGRGSGCLAADDSRRRAGQEQANRAVSRKLRARESAA